MSDSALRLRNRGAYTSPYSGVGQEFLPLGVMPDHSGIVLHEVGYIARNDWFDFPHVLSPFWRLYYNRRRGHCVIFGDQSIELGPENIVLIPDHQLFHCRGVRPVPNVWLHFTPVRRLAAEQRIPILLAPSPLERALLRRLMSLWAGTDDCVGRDAVYHTGLALLHVVLSRDDVSWQAALPSAVADTVRHIEKHFHTPLSVGQLAARVGLSREWLGRSFHRFLGESVGRFIAKVRVREAAHLLLHTHLAIEEVADATGFPNRAYLSRVFKKVTGQSPAAFRARHRHRHPSQSKR